MRLGEQRNRADVGRQDLAIAVENVGTRGHQAVGRQNAGGHFRLGIAILHETAADHRIGDGEAGDHQADALAGEFRLALAGALEGGAVDRGPAPLHVGREMRLALQQHDS
ncbi:hypothetical protein D3C72_1870430 [compost metagenome]